MMAWILIPEVLLSVGSLVILVVDSFAKASPGRTAGLIAIFVLAAALTLLLSQQTVLPGVLAGDLAHNSLSRFFQVLVLLAAIGSMLLSIDYFKDEPQEAGRIAALIIFSVVGMLVLISSTHFLVLYLGLELMTFPVYLAVTAVKKDSKAFSLEAALKYFLMGGVASAVFLFGVSLVYASGGTLEFSRLVTLAADEGPQGLALFGMALMTLTVFFKLSVFPFHFWAPDAYEGAPTPVTGFMATAVKVTAIAFLLKVLFALIHALPDAWSGLVATLSILTMTWGNWAALHQKNLNRLLAYSSIAHVGYMLIAVSFLRYDSGQWHGPIESLLVYLMGYVAMTLGAFSIFSGYRLRTLDETKGFAKKAPVAAAALTLFFLSLMGIPPTAGFLGKFYVLMDALKEGWVALAIVGALNSALAAFYYLKVVRTAYLEEGRSSASAHLSWSPLIVISFSAVSVLFIGLWPALRSAITHLIF